MRTAQQRPPDLPDTILTFPAGSTAGSPLGLVWSGQIRVLRSLALTGPHHLVQRGMERPAQVRCCLPESLTADRGIEFIL
jgi:hypothetical protein